MCVFLPYQPREVFPELMASRHQPGDTQSQLCTHLAAEQDLQRDGQRQAHPGGGAAGERDRGSWCSEGHCGLDVPLRQPALLAETIMTGQG